MEFRRVSAGGAGSRHAPRVRNGHTTALFTDECRSFLDNVIAGFGRIGARNDPRRASACRLPCSFPDFSASSGLMDRSKRRAWSALQLALELVPVAPVRSVGENLVRTRLDHACFAQ